MSPNLTLRFIPRLENPLGLVLVVGFEARLGARDFVFEVEDAPAEADQTVCLLHRFAHGCECEAAGTDAVSGQWTSVDRAEPNSARAVEQVKNPVKIKLSSISESLAINDYDLEARVGIGPFRRGFRDKITRFDRLLKHDLVLTDNYSVTAIC